MSLNKSSEETPLKSLNNTGIFSFPQGFPSPPEGLASLNLPMVPPHLLLAMQSNLPPEKVREMLTEQAEMLDQMASKLKSAKEDDLESIRGSVSKKVKELEKEIVIEKKINSDWDKRDDLYNNRDIDMLKQEINSIKLREESTYLDLQKAHHQTRMLESQLLELQRKYFSELEHLNFENAELRRKLEAAEYRNVNFI
jgi:predicted  nucleic acid-binding Zn-ribbon protein